MNAAPQQPWTIDRFLAWAETQDAPYEFDGVRPVAMTGGTARHGRITGNIYAALRLRLRGTSCSNFGPDLGVRTTGSKIRYPDALVTCTKFPDTDKLAPNVVVVFEVISPTSGGMDRITKLREYAGVSSILRYVIVESAVAGLQVLQRETGDAQWIVTAVTADEILSIPEVGIEVPVAELYEDVTFDDAATGGADA